ncbi:MAG TPA: hypothetical protein VH062_31500 [Polyangiaceae bacterium]|jgi:hypothetical protein|nr:hypothetical protein [Polyangiaceae bacterium]
MTYSATVPVSNAHDLDNPALSRTTKKPLLEVEAYCDANANGKVDTGETCFAFASQSVGDGAHVTLTNGTCPKSR